MALKEAVYFLPPTEKNPKGPRKGRRDNLGSMPLLETQSVLLGRKPTVQGDKRGGVRKLRFSRETPLGGGEGGGLLQFVNRRSEKEILFKRTR